MPYIDYVSKGSFTSNHMLSSTLGTRCCRRRGILPLLLSVCVLIIRLAVPECLLWKLFCNSCLCSSEIPKHQLQIPVTSSVKVATVIHLQHEANGITQSSFKESSEQYIYTVL